MDKRKQPLRLALLVMALSILACTQAVITPTPTALPPSPTAPATLPPSPAPSATATEAEDVATVRAALVNVRQTPGGDVIGQLIAGQDVTVLGCVDSWCEVQADELTGFVYQGCLSINDGLGCEAK